MNKPTPKDRLSTLLHGGIPDLPPHFELVFFLYKEMFGMDIQTVMDRTYGSERDRADAVEAFHREVALRCVDEFGYAAVAAPHYERGIDPCRASKNLKKEVGDKALVCGFSDSGVFWMPTGDGFEAFAERMFERPDDMHTEAKWKVRYTKERTLRQLDAGVDFIIQNTDFGFNAGPFISPKHFREFCTPYMAELVAFMHDNKLPVIMHSDGNLNAILDQIYSTGVDGYQSVDPQGFMDIGQVRQQYPDWLLMGNISCALLQDVDEGKIRAAVRGAMKHGGVGKRYIFSTSNCIFSGMPPESYRIMLDEYHRICNDSVARKP